MAVVLNLKENQKCLQRSKLWWYDLSATDKVEIKQEQMHKTGSHTHQVGDKTFIFKT
jgi:hypothetical protein